MVNAAASDRDLLSIREAQTLARRAKEAQAELAEFSQEQIDDIVAAMASAATEHAEASAIAAVKETGYGVIADKIQKNLFASQDVYRFIKPLKTVGVVSRDEARKVVEIAEPFGVVAAIVPSTNPTSTTIFKALIAIKARCAIVLSPHPSATICIGHIADILIEAATKAGAPIGAISVMRSVTVEGTQELMRHPDISLILATGGMGLVRSAYSSGKPAYGVGPGNAPAYIERSADVPKAVRDIVTGKTFDNGVLCSSENSVITDEVIVDQVRKEFRANGACFLTAGGISAVGKVLVSPQRLPNPSLVGKTAVEIANAAGIAVPPSTRVLIAELQGVGRDYPLSIEKLCPVLSFYVVKDWHEACERCKQILRYGGMGHTMSIHSNNKEVVLEFGLKKPAFRIVVNTPTTHGSIGLTTGLDPSMTLGCGGYGGNITSDNISPLHLLNIKRLAYEVKATKVKPAQEIPGISNLPKTSVPLPSAGIEAGALTQKIDQFLSTRGYQPASVPKPSSPDPVLEPQEGSAKIASFVCEQDVRLAHQEGRRIRIGDETIVTPAAKDFAREHKIFIPSDWQDQ